MFSGTANGQSALNQTKSLRGNTGFLLSGVSKVCLNKLYFVALVEEYLMVKSRDNREKKRNLLRENE